MKTLVIPQMQPPNKIATPSQQTALRLANEYRLRMLTILEANIEQALSIGETAINDSPGLRVNSYYFLSFMLFLKKHNPTVLKNIKKTRLLSEKRLKTLISEIETSLEIEHGIEWSITTSPSFYAVSGTVTNQTSSQVIYATNGYVEVAFLRADEELKKQGKFKRSGHLTDQMLKYNYPKDKSPQLNIFDALLPETKTKIQAANTEIKEIVEGIKLSPSETKVIDCLCRLLHETSQNSDAKREDYYSGNIGHELVDYGGDKNTPAPKLAFTLYELTKEYKGGEYVAGKDIENVKQILTELDEKKFLLSYVETTKIKGGGRRERKIEDFRKLIHIVKISQTEYSKEDIELSKEEETVILLNPIFRRQIDSKFILYPNDINRRTIIAYGSHNLSGAAIRLRDYLMRERDSKRYEPKISLDKLYYLLAEKWMKESRRKKVKEFTDKAIETVKALGLLVSHEIKTGATGEAIVVFTLDKDWE